MPPRRVCSLPDGTIRDRHSRSPSLRERLRGFAGVSLHVAVTVPAGDRRRLERLSQFASRLKRSWRVGTLAFVFALQGFVAWWAALAPLLFRRGVCV